MAYGRRRNKKSIVYTDGYIIPIHEKRIIFKDDNNNKLHKKICSSMKEVIHFLDYHELLDYNYVNIPEKYLLHISQ